MKNYLIIGITVVAIIGSIIFYFHKRDEMQFKKGFDAGINKCENSCKSDKIEVHKIESQNNEKIINENVQVLKRKEVYRAISVSDDLKFVREHFTNR